MKYISVEQALEAILERGTPLQNERVDLLSAVGRISAEEIKARRALPPFDNSAMDGYALRAEDGINPRKLVGTIACGDPPGTIDLKTGEAVRIFTGAPIPKGADTICMQEYAKEIDQTVSFTREYQKGQHIRQQGTDLAQGEVFIRPGDRIGAAQVSALATQGRSFLAVYRKPQVAILSTGSELVEIDEEPEAGFLVNSNAYALAAMIKEAGANAHILGTAPDEKEATKTLLENALFSDVIVTSGGVSVGEFDYVKIALDELGYEPIFWKIAMKPGKPVVFGILKGRPVLGLPGNPASCQVSFALFVYPLLQALAGDQTPGHPRFLVSLLSPVRSKDRRHFMRATISRNQRGDLLALPLRKQGSSEVNSLLGANALLDIPANTQYSAGDQIEAILYRTSFLQKDDS